MKMKNLVDAIPSIRKIANQDLRARTLYRVSLLLDRFEGELKTYDEVRGKLIARYCDTVDGKVIPRKETSADFEKDMLELLDMELDMENIKIVEIPEDEDFKISYADLCAMNGFIKIKFEEEN
jgi:hypothetical protein